MKPDRELNRALNRRTFTLGLFALPLVGAAGCQTAPTTPREDPVSLDEPPKSPSVNEYFHYRHEGPRPFSDPDLDASGERVVRVQGREEGGQRLWRIEEAYENSVGIIAYLVDNLYRMHRQIILSGEGEYVAEFNPPLPLRYQNLAKNASMTIRTQQQFREEGVRDPLARFDINGRASRRYDERIVTPIGAFMCRAFDVELAYVITVENTRVQYEIQIRSYWSDQFSWFVSEEYQFSPARQNNQVLTEAYECQSMLTDYIPPPFSG